jgi:hypothetical protein
LSPALLIYLKHLFPLKNMKTTLQHFFSLCLLACIVLLASSCKKENDKAPAAQEKVTGISLALTSEQKGVLDVSLDFNDSNGLAGKTSPNTVTLDANTTYTGTLMLEDASKSPAKDVTADYEVSFQAEGTGVSISKSGEGLSVETGDATAGTLHMDLKRNGQTQRVSFPLTVRE